MNYFTTVEDMRRTAQKEEELDRGANINLRADSLELVEKLIRGEQVDSYDLFDISNYYFLDIDTGFYEETNEERYIAAKKAYNKVKEEDGDELVLVSAADDIWMSKSECEELNIPYYEV